MKQKLEQILAFAPKTADKATIDQYVSGTVGLFTPPPAPTWGYGMHTPSIYTQPETPRIDNGWGNVTSINYAPEPMPLWEPPKYELPKYEPLRIYDLPGTELQIHLHNDCASGNIQSQGNHLHELNSYESAMEDHYAKLMGFKKTDTTCRGKFDDYL